MDDLIQLNGINGATGEYLAPQMTIEQAAKLARGGKTDQDSSGWLDRIWKAMQRPFMGLPLDIDATEPAQAGWAVVYGPDTPGDVVDALQPLITHRRNTIPPDRCLELHLERNENSKSWLRRHGVYPGSVAPTKIPYYLLLVGGPKNIPFQFQYLMDIEYAVGRLAFDEAAPYRQYAESIIEYESSIAVPNQREIAYWGARHKADRATQMSADHLITPLFAGQMQEDASRDSTIAEACQFASRCFLAADATKANLAELLHGRENRPSMLFTASHGMGWPMAHEHQPSAQGALLCQDWSGFGSVEEGHYLAANDVEDDANLSGLVAFLFACFGAGTPKFDNFVLDRGTPAPLAPESLVAPLAQRLLSHPQGSALAVLGHIDRAWAYSIRPPGTGPQLQPFRNLVGRILNGEPVGHSTKDFSDRYAVVSSQLLSMLDESQPGEKPEDDELARMWIERNDAQNYIMLGDPAVRLRVDSLAAAKS